MSEQTATLTVDPEKQQSRILSSVGRRVGSSLLAKCVTTAPDSGGSKPRYVRGEILREERIEQQLEYLQSIAKLREQAAKPEHRSWRNLLSGEIPEVSGGGIRPSLTEAIKRSGLSTDKKHSRGHKVIDTGADYDTLKREHPTERYKFYHSFGDSEAATEYLTEVLKRAGERGISISLKTYDHAYDGVNIYTYHFREMQEIIQEMYGMHRSAWGATEHFLQGPIEGVDPSHIGWVQEPGAGLGTLSHSGRMGQVGSALDARGLVQDSYLAGCQIAGVRPDMPWLLTSGYEAEIVERSAEIHAR